MSWSFNAMGSVEKVKEVVEKSEPYRVPGEDANADQHDAAQAMVLAELDRLAKLPRDENNNGVIVEASGHVDGSGYSSLKLEVKTARLAI